MPEAMSLPLARLCRHPSFDHWHESTLCHSQDPADCVHVLLEKHVVKCGWRRLHNDLGKKSEAGQDHFTDSRPAFDQGVGAFEIGCVDGA